MKIIITLVLFLTIFFSSNGQTVYKDSIAPKIEFTNWIKSPIDISVIKNKPVVLEFWATWCGPCVEAIPHFNELANKYKEEMVFVAVNSFETKEVVEKFLTKNPISSFVALDEKQNLKNAFNIQNVPVTLLIDKDRMLRWRGITSELTDDLLTTFLAENTFNDTYKHGIMLDKIFSISSLENLNYNLIIEQGDITMGKGITTDTKAKFFLSLSNYNIGLALTTFSDWFSMDDNWQFLGNKTEDEVYNISIQCDRVLKDDIEIKTVLNDVISKLTQTFNFSTSRNEEIQNIWYIIPDILELKKYRSKNQKLDTKVIEKTEEYLLYQNMFNYLLVDLLSAKTNRKFKSVDTKTSFKYDLQIPRSNDILEIKNFLKEKYGIQLVNKTEKVQIRKATFN